MRSTYGRVDLESAWAPSDWYSSGVVGDTGEGFASTNAVVEGDMVLPFDAKVVDVLVGISPEVPLEG